MSRFPLLLVGLLIPLASLSAAAEPDFALEVRGTPPGVAPEQFRRDVLASLPPALTDPASNFTRADGYRPDGRYRLVMQFHRGGEMPAEGLCRAEETAETPPPKLDDLQTTTQLVAAFCDNTKPLSVGRGQVAGETSPDQASFRFMVGDVAKQLFPSGFNVLPGVGAAAATEMP